MSAGTGDSPETALSFEDTLVPADGQIHNPVVEKPAEQLAEQDSNLATC